MNRRYRLSAKVVILLTVLSVALLTAGTLSAETQHEKHIRYATELIADMRRQSDASDLGGTIRGAKAIAVFPKTLQAGIVIGGMHGEGVVLVRDGKGGWKGPSFASLSGGSFGLQIGAKEVGLVLVINNSAGLQVFTGGKSFKLGGDVSIAAGPVGRDASAATDSRADASIYSYSMSKGLFAGVALSGSTINVNGDSNRAYWGKKTSASTALARAATGKKILPLVIEIKRLEKGVK